MKKLLVAVLLLSFAALAFADDALVLPKGVIRVRATGAYTTATQEFDKDGEKTDLAGDEQLNMFNVGGAIEYGVVEGVNAAVQWIPGYVVYSQFKEADTAHLNGPFDLFIGAKLQFIGDQGLVQKDETMRLAAALGFVAPLPGADFKKEAENAGAGDDFIAADVDRHQWGLGFRGYFDYVINDMFYLNLYTEFIKYLKGDQKFLAFTPAPTVIKAEVDYGYQLTLEFEPHFEMPIAEGFKFNAGLPVTYVTNPEVKMEGNGVDDTASYSLNLRPYVSVFMTKILMPVEVEIGYLYPLAGKNVGYANSALTFQVKAYAKF
jgi:hypothetical protein